MELGDIDIENFCSAGHMRLKLNQPGLILIQGVNKDAPKADSNGAGKSIVFDAICWCLWGKTVRGLSGDEVVRDNFNNGKRTSGKDCAVTLSVRDNGDYYQISRHRADSRIDKPNDFKLFINGVEKGRKMKNLQEVVDRVIGFDFETFCAMMPGTGIKASSMTDSQIKKLLEKILQTEQLSAAYEQARTRGKEVAAALAMSTTRQAKIMLELSGLNTEVGQLRDLELSFEANKAAQISKHKVRMDELLAEVEECDSQLKEFAKLDEISKTVIADLAAANESLLLEVTRPNNALVFKYQDELNKIQQQIHTAESEITRLVVQMQEIKNLDAECVLCSQNISHAHKDAQLLRLQGAKQVQRALISMQTEAKKQLQADIKLDLLSLDARKAELTSLIAIHTESLRMLRNAQTPLCSASTLKQRAAAEFQREKKSLKEAKALTQNFQVLFKDKADKAFELTQELASILKQTNELTAEQKLCQFWVDGFSPAGLRSFMLDYVTPILNDRAAYYSEVLTSGVMKITFTTKKTLKNGEVRDQFQINVDQRHGSELYSGISTGEKARADLIISMALSDLAAYRTAKQLPWKFLDEPFENIDKTGNEAVIGLLNDHKNRYKTVFVITHKPSLQNMFTQKVTVTKEGGVSSLECNW